MGGLFLLALMLVATGFLVPSDWWNSTSHQFLLLIGIVGVWRYGWGSLHICRSLLYRHIMFPRMRRRLERLGDAAMPSHVYLLITSFRISTTTTARVYRGAIREALRSGLDCTIVASIVDIGDEWLIRRLFAALVKDGRLRLVIVRIAGTGKRDALAEGFLAISRDRPPRNAAVCVIDGDSILGPGILRASLPFLVAYPCAGALTTDEICEVEGSGIFRDWYSMRFAQRQILMGSMGLSRRVLTLTGRMSAFKSSIVCDPTFIAMIREDCIDHWRFGRLKFLTGDDKSSWYFLLRAGYEMLYIPDVRIRTIETPPHPDFAVASTQLMMRWFGNMLRTNARAIALGPTRIGWFVWWSVIDQRLSMWTSLTGLTGALLMAIAGRYEFVLAYVYWVALSRFAQTLVLLSARERVSWTYPFLLYYNQIYGSLIKTYMLFHQDRQKWTRQNTTLGNISDISEYRWTKLGSHSGHVLSILLLIWLIGSTLEVIDFGSAISVIEG